MRITILVLTFAVSCAASPAFAQARVLTLPAQPPALKQVQREMPAPAAADKTQDQTPSSARVQPPAQAKRPASSAIVAAPPPPVKLQDKIELGWRRPLRMPPLGRFNFKRVDNGFLRFDRAAGKVTFCSPHNAVWGCEAVPEHRAALEREIAGLRERMAVLQGEVAALKKEIAGLGKPPAPPPPPPPSPPEDQKSGVKIQLPSAKDIAQARSFIEDTWRQLQQMIQDMQKDMMRKS